MAESIEDPLTGQHVTFLLRASDTDGSLLRAQVRLAPGGRVPSHLHVRHDERVRVLTGSVVVRVGREDRVLGPGDEIDVPRRKVHTVRNAGGGAAEFVLEARPAGRMETGMRAVFAVGRALSRVTGHRR